MKKYHLFSIVALFMLTLSVTTVKSQKESKKFSVGFGLEGGLPIGDANTCL